MVPLATLAASESGAVVSLFRCTSLPSLPQLDEIDGPTFGKCGVWVEEVEDCVSESGRGRQRSRLLPDDVEGTCECETRPAHDHDACERGLPIFCSRQIFDPSPSCGNRSTVMPQNKGIPRTAKLLRSSRREGSMGLSALFGRLQTPGDENRRPFSDEDIGDCHGRTGFYDLKNFCIDGVLYKGPTATVVKTVSPRDDGNFSKQGFAVKVFVGDPAFSSDKCSATLGADLFHNEYTHLHRAQGHPNVVGFCGWGCSGGFPALILEHLEGQNLRQWLCSPQSAAITPHLQLNFRYELVCQVASVISFLHSRGEEHCDIKPENFVFRTKADGYPRLSQSASWRPQLVLVDFASATSKSVPGRLGNKEHDGGTTVAYASPETLIATGYRSCSGMLSSPPLLTRAVSSVSYEELDDDGDPCFYERDIHYGDYSPCTPNAASFHEGVFGARDVWALGLVMSEILGGESYEPFKDFSDYQIAQHMSRSTQPVEIPDSICDVLIGNLCDFFTFYRLRRGGGAPSPAPYHHKLSFEAFSEVWKVCAIVRVRTVTLLRACLDTDPCKRPCASEVLSEVKVLFGLIEGLYKKHAYLFHV